MNEPGHIYILVNPSIVGRVKIGKTTRDPDLRAKELSQATGVATPFYVAFSIEVDDCHTAEEYVYAVLDWNGFKRTPNREFFEIPLRKAIEVLMTAETALKEQQIVQGSEETTGVSGAEDDNEESVEPIQERHPGRDVFEVAIATYYGYGDTIRDEEEAIRLLHQAKALNFPAAYSSLAEYYAFTQIEDPGGFGRALAILKEGAQKGHGRCYIKMAWLFRNICGKEDRENAAKCWKRYFQSQTFLLDDDEKWTGPGCDDVIGCDGLDSLFDSGFPRMWHAQNYLDWVADGSISADPEVREILRPLRDEIIAQIKRSIPYHSRKLMNGTANEKQAAREGIVRDTKRVEFAEKFLAR